MIRAVEEVLSFISLNAIPHYADHDPPRVFLRRLRRFLGDRSLKSPLWLSGREGISRRGRTGSGSATEPACAGSETQAENRRTLQIRVLPE